MTATRTGLRSISAASAPISFGMVAEKNRLWRLARKLGQDLPDRPDEAHVEHLVGLVEHEDLGARQDDAALVHVLDEAAGRGDEDVDAAAHGRDLRPVRDAAVHQGDGQVHVAAVGLEALRDLRRQLARRRQDERRARPGAAPGGGWRQADAGSAARRPPSCRCRSGRCPADPCRRARCGMACAWIGVGDRVAFGFERLQKGCVQPELGKCGQLQYLSYVAARAGRPTHVGRARANAAGPGDAPRGLGCHVR